MPQESKVSHPAVRGITGGDSNPDRPSGVFAPIGFGVALSLAADPRRARISLLRAACCEDRTPYQELFQFRRSFKVKLSSKRGTGILTCFPFTDRENFLSTYNHLALLTQLLLIRLEKTLQL